MTDLERRFVKAAKLLLERDCSAGHGGDCSVESHQKLRALVIEASANPPSSATRD
jgi:hypothetical protein